MKSAALAIFAKTIGLSPVKTRLGAATGTQFAEEFYSLSTKAVAEVAEAFQAEMQGSITPYWAVAEEAAVRDKSWGSFPVMWTGEGGLGSRLHTTYSRLIKGHDYVMMIGTDSPGLTPTLLKEAVHRLTAQPYNCLASCMVGPCPDGGFYLFAAKLPIPENLWTSVTYSAESTLKELTGQLEQLGIEVCLTSKLGDVDRVEDLPLLMLTLEKMSCRLPGQTKLYEWLRKHKNTFEP